MTSKKSYFSPTIFFKDIRVSWPLWTIYLLALLIWMPTRLLMQFMNNAITDGGDSSQNLSSLRLMVNPNYVIGAAFFMALVYGLVLFQYLNTARTANMLHSLPLNRLQLYLTKLAAGLTLLLAPLLVTFLVSSLICIAYHVTSITVLLEWFGVGAGASFVAFSMVAFCALLAGHGAALVFYYALLNVIYPVVHFILRLFIGFFGFGISIGSISSEMGAWTFLCPAWQLVKVVDLKTVYNGESGAVFSVGIVGFQTLLFYMLFALLLYVLAFLLYRKRKLELAGDMVAIPFVRPIVRWLVGWIVGALMAYIIYYFLTLSGRTIDTYGLLTSLLLFGFLGFMASQMVIKKSFRIFRKKFLLEAFCFLVLCCATFFGSIGVARYRENYVPDYDDLEYACITFSYPLYCYGDDISFIEKIQHELTANKDQIDGARLPATDRYLNITIEYAQKNGETITRNYNLVSNEISDAIGAKIENVEWEANHFINGYFPYIAENNGITSSGVDVYDAENDTYYSTTELLQYDRTFCAAMWEAIQKDAQTYALQKYNIQTSYSKDHSYDYDGQYVADLDFTYQTSLDQAPDEDDDMYGKYWSSDNDKIYFCTYLSFGPDCENIIQCLIDYGVIFSRDDLITMEDYNELYEQSGQTDSNYETID